MDEDTGEILVVRDPFRRRIEVHIKGAIPDAYRVVRLNRNEARQLAALILFQAERLGDARLARAAVSSETGLKSA
jgi:hypothetical protein